MKHFLLKFNHGVEIGANLAYLGHYRRTKDYRVLQIANDEVEHREAVAHLLSSFNEKPNKFIDNAFKVIGNAIFWACQISPNFALNIVARTMEAFAIFNYNNLAKKYPAHSELLLKMADKELEHKEYFK